MHVTGAFNRRKPVRLFGALQTLRRNRSGVALTEFALSLPLLRRRG